MKIAITGGCGRLGRAVIDLALSHHHQVVNIDQVPLSERPSQPAVEQCQLDLTDFDAFEQSLTGCKALIHLAAIPSPRRDPAHIVHNNNVQTSYNALIAAANLGISAVCLASSINATGGVFSRRPRFDYFPLDEKHPTYNEDPYSLSKWIGEQQADSVARRYEWMKIASLRLHGLGPGRPSLGDLEDPRNEWTAKHLWGYTSLESAARACLLSLTTSFTGHEVLYIVAPETMMTTPSLELARHFYPDVPIIGDLSGNKSFFNTQKAQTLLNWHHDPGESHAPTTNP